jgi:CO dehydrogenase/acetyl-CoA synthase gamma subunit (corrinoid Fe-S protein)
MNGIIVFYINFHHDLNLDIQSTIDFVYRINQANIERIHKDSGYQVMIVPTQKEACRVEKIDFDKPFPRYAKKSHIDFAEEDRRAALQ